jgi:hypothetical protein
MPNLAMLGFGNIAMINSTAYVLLQNIYRDYWIACLSDSNNTGQLYIVQYVVPFSGNIS